MQGKGQWISCGVLVRLWAQSWVFCSDRRALPSWPLSFVESSGDRQALVSLPISYLVPTQDGRPYSVFLNRASCEVGRGTACICERPSLEDCVPC